MKGEESNPLKKFKQDERFSNINKDRFGKKGLTKIKQGTTKTDHSHRKVNNDKKSKIQKHLIQQNTKKRLTSNS